MLRSGYGRIVNIASISGKVCSEGKLVWEKTTRLKTNLCIYIYNIYMYLLYQCICIYIYS